MDAKDRRRIEMGKRALLFTEQHPDESGGDTVTVSRLRQLLQRAEELFKQQFRGRSQVHAGAERKLELRRELIQGHLRHVAAVAQAAGSEVPDLRFKFLVTRPPRPHADFLTLARKVESNARAEVEQLERYGLSRTALDSLTETVTEFERAIGEVNAGRMAHVGARAELREIGRQILVQVRILDGNNRIRLRHNSELLAAWESARRVLARPERADLAESSEPAMVDPPAEGPGSHTPAA